MRELHAVSVPVDLDAQEAGRPTKVLHLPQTTSCLVLVDVLEKLLAYGGRLSKPRFALAGLLYVAGCQCTQRVLLQKWACGPHILVTLAALSELHLR